MRKDFDNDQFDFLDELEIHESTKEKPVNRGKNKTENRIKKSKPEEKGAAEKRAVRKKTTGEKAAPAAPQRPKCAFRTRIVDAPSMRFESDILALLGGEAFADLALRPEDWVFIDTETTGLSRGVGTVAFEVGVGEIVGRQLSNVSTMSRILETLCRDTAE